MTIQEQAVLQCVYNSLPECGRSEQRPLAVHLDRHRGEDDGRCADDRPGEVSGQQRGTKAHEAHAERPAGERGEDQRFPEGEGRSEEAPQRADDRAEAGQHKERVSGLQGCQHDGQDDDQPDPRERGGNAPCRVKEQEQQERGKCAAGSASECGGHGRAGPQSTMRRGVDPLGAIGYDSWDFLMNWAENIIG